MENLHDIEANSSIVADTESLLESILTHIISTGVTREQAGEFDDMLVTNEEILGVVNRMTPELRLRIDEVRRLLELQFDA